MLARSLVCILVALSFSAMAQDKTSLVLSGGTVYTSPTAPPVTDGVVVIEGGKIAAVGPRARVSLPPGAEILDCTGRVVTAGFWNTHVHFTELKWANAPAIPGTDLAAQMQETFTRYGFTSVFDISSVLENTLALQRRVDAGEAPGPRIFTTGLGMVPPDSQVGDARYAKMGWMSMRLPELTDAASGDAAAAAAIKSGAHGIKLFMSGPSNNQLAKNELDPAAVRAAVAETHRNGWPVFVHPNTGADIVAAAAGGADIIAHTTPLAGPWDDAVLTAMEDRDVALIPTLWIWKAIARQSGPEAEAKTVEIETAQLKAWITRKGTVLFGTDLGAVRPDPTEEYILMSGAGMDFRAILASLTLAPAKRFGRGADLGQIAPGFLADITVLKADPGADPRKLSEVQYTLRDGRVIYRAP